MIVEVSCIHTERLKQKPATLQGLLSTCLGCKRGTASQLRPRYPGREQEWGRKESATSCQWKETRQKTVNKNRAVSRQKRGSQKERLWWDWCSFPESPIEGYAVHTQATQGQMALPWP